MPDEFEHLVANGNIENIIACADKVYNWLPGSSSGEVKERALQVCSCLRMSDPATLISCAEKMYNQLPGSGAEVKEKTLNLCTNN